MKGINLLPWREEKRHARDRRMLGSAVLIWAICLTSIFGGYSYLQVLKKNQNQRNGYLTVEIKKLDKKVKALEDTLKKLTGGKK